jgi:hypothetical protein
MGREVMIALLLSVERLRGGVGLPFPFWRKGHDRLQPITELDLQCRHASRRVAQYSRPPTNPLLYIFRPCYQTVAVFTGVFSSLLQLSFPRTTQFWKLHTMADTPAPTSGQNDQSANRGRNNRPRGGRGGNRAPREGQDAEQSQGGNRNAGRSRGRGGRARGGAPGGAPASHQPSDAKPQPTTEQQIQAKGKALALVPQTEDGDDVEAEVCFICASPVVHQSVAPCNHRTCHICSLRLRALYKTKTCAHCRVCWSSPLVSLQPLTIS